MNKYRREVTIEIIVGLFMFTVLIALGIFTIVLSSENLLQKPHLYDFVFSEVSGLREGDNVYLRGVSVGRVKQTALEDGKVRVYVTLDKPITLRHGYKIDVVNASMLGGKYLKIYEGPDDAPVLGGNVTILGSTPFDMIEDLGRAVKGLQSMITAVSEGQGTLGKLLKDDAMYNNMVAISEDLKRIVERIEGGEGTLGKLLISDDGQMYDDTKALMANLRTVSQNLADGKGTLGKMLSGSVDDTAYDDLQATLASVRSISESINAGEGTLGKLVRDAKLYDETTAFVEDIRAAVDDLREASPITSFGSVLFGAF
jgi:phospholipid/cholesterol/gamma-HCH transport system substrate-binding protein